MSDSLGSEEEVCVTVDASVVAPMTKAPKSSAYAEAADPTKYRAKDAALFSCAAHGDAAVLCTTAGKNGRNGRTAAVGATVLWLTCPYINHTVARMERCNGVQVATRCFREHETLRQRHIRSHAVYLERVKELLDAPQWCFFHTHFAEPADEGSKKFGNAAVCHEGDLKCLHALVAQTLGGAPNPLGDAAVNYMLFCHHLVSAAHSWGANSEDGAAPPPRQRLVELIHSEDLFYSFLAQTVAVGNDKDGAQVEVCVAPPNTAGADARDTPWKVSVAWTSDVGRLQALAPDLCQRCMELIAFLDGKPPTARRKRRIN